MLLWLLHQKGLFDPLYDWWEDRFWANNQSIGDTRRHGIDVDNSGSHLKHHKQEARHYRHDAQGRRRSIHEKRRHKHSLEDSEYYYLHHVHKNKHKQGRSKNSSVAHQVYLDRREDDGIGQHRRRKEKELPYLKKMKHGEEKHAEFNKHKHGQLNDTHIKLHTKHRG